MNYRNRGPRCRHGMLIGVIDCPGCGEAKPKRQAGGSYYVRSMGGHVVIKKRATGRRGGGAFGYQLGRVRG